MTNETAGKPLNQAPDAAGYEAGNPGVVCIWCGEGFCTEGKDLPAIVAWGQAHDRGCERNPLRAEVEALRELLLDMRQHQGSIQPYIKRIDAALAKEGT